MPAGAEASSSRWRPRGDDAFAITLLAATWGWLFRAVWLGRGLVFDGEVHEILLPLHHYLRDQLLEHRRFPLWNPHLFLGYPWLGAIQAGPLYPVSWLFDLAMPVERALSWNLAAHFLLAGATAYGFARRALGVRAEAALLAASIYAFNGHMVGNLGQLHNHATLAWAPLVLLAIHELARRDGRRVRWIGVGALALGASALGGMAQQSAYLALVFAGFAVTRLADLGGGGRSRNERADAALALVGTLALAVAMFAPQWRATDALLAESARAGLEGPASLAVAAGSLSGADLLGLLFPNLVGWGALGAFNTSFVGVVPVALALAGAWRSLSRADRTERFFAVVWVAALAFAAGRNNPLTAAIYEIPGVALFHDPARAVAIALLAASVLSARALHRLGEGDETTRKTVLVMLVGMGGVIGGVRLAYWLGWVELPEAPVESYATEVVGPSRNALQIASLLALAVALLAVARSASSRVAAARVPAILAASAIALLAWFATPFVRTEAPAAVERFVRGPAALGSVPRAGSVVGAARLANLDRDDVAVEPFESEFRWASVTGFSSLAPREVLELTRGSRDVDPLRLTAYLDYTRIPAILDLTAARYLLGRRPFPERGAPLAQGEGFFVYENPSALPRAFVVGEACSAGVERALRGLTDGTLDPRATVILIDEARLLAAPCVDAMRGSAGTGAPLRPARIEVDDPDRMVVAFDGLDLGAAGGWLVVLDRHAPGWLAWVDGEARPVIRADVAFRAVEIPRGAERVELRYQPFGQRALFGLALTAAAVALTLAFAPRRGTRARGGRAGSGPASRAPGSAPPGTAP